MALLAAAVPAAARHPGGWGAGVRVLPLHYLVLEPCGTANGSFAYDAASQQLSCAAGCVTWSGTTV
eukprot:gene3056-234_t